MLEVPLNTSTVDPVTAKLEPEKVKLVCPIAAFVPLAVKMLDVVVAPVIVVNPGPVYP